MNASTDPADQSTDLDRGASPGQAARLLRAAVPFAGWRRLDLVVRLLSTVEEYQLTVIMPDGATPAVDPPPELAPLFRSLRRQAFTPDAGTWYSARLTLDSRSDGPGFVYTENFEADPGWTPPAPPEAYLDDLGAVFGAAEPRVPRWLAGILGGDR
ncbi:hypothetical protein KGQ20_38520 [Catenulispora sp. NF23]|uniref:hypothetical protein n=1 Tax=Catenulispora pinistramenti TaxID=2705254 RepID=UPI001BAA20D8|nr:hypothetical protein [Catenulispora pinistramenti]MBS2538658.1 hypothetical protein [Catenulispora pinistramenti]